MAAKKRKTGRKGLEFLVGGAVLALMLSGCAGGSQPDSTPSSEAGRGAQTAEGSEASGVSETEKEIQPRGGETEPDRGESQASGKEGISEEEARQIALDHAEVAPEQAVFVKSGRETEDGREVYELEFRAGVHEEYEYEIDAATGEILSYQHETSHEEGPAGGAVTADEAKELVLARVPGAALSDIWEFEADSEHHRTEYEGKILYDGVEYEFKIDGDTGAVLEWSEESQGGS